MKYIYLFCLLAASFVMHGQSAQGVILNTDGKPLSDVLVYATNSDHHTHSNLKGEFMLKELSDSDTLRFQLLGFEPQEFIPSSAESIQVVLEESPIRLEEVVIAPGLSSRNLFSAIDLQTNPVSSSQEILQQVPGLFIAQHAGGGKAEQIFLRGFDIDHGTDISIAVDGIPVNMVSHAHGQGYADLHFLIPEVIEQVDFGKGPHYSEQGNFTTAGYVNFKTKDQFQNNLLQLEGGQFGHTRMLGVFDFSSSSKLDAWVATELLRSDGPFESPQDLQRLNVMAKVGKQLQNGDQISLSGSYFTSEWDASGQIPQRAVDQGLITRFGAIDDTEGGQTSRWNLNLEYQQILDESSQLEHQVFMSNYQFELFSNFTFFLNDPINGDQIRQWEDRMLYGYQTRWKKYFGLGDTDWFVQAQAGFRGDEVRESGLSRTANRKTELEPIRLGTIRELNSYASMSALVEWNNWQLEAGLRVDHFNFRYTSLLETTYNPQIAQQAIFQPKIGLYYNKFRQLQLFLKAGKGFHSNDARLSATRPDLPSLPAAYGIDLGAVFKPSPKILVQTTLWQLFLEQEFVYVGDEGIIEPSGRSNRLGADLEIRYEATDWLFFHTDVTYTFARSIDEEAGEQYIPLAPDLTAVAGIQLKADKLYGGLQLRYLKDRAANEDYSLIAEGYTLLDGTIGWDFGRLDLGIEVNNLLNTEWNEAQFATTSRLDFEQEPTEEIHFTPGNPFRMNLRMRFEF